MENFEPGPAAAGVIVPASQVLRLAVATYLARFKVQSRIHTDSDLRGYLTWCKTRGVDPLGRDPSSHRGVRPLATKEVR
jgi:integrase/recombinase XerD